jgi:hypothetical protein
MRFGEEIAVLDGLGDLPTYYQRRNVIDASAGANYSGGSSWPGDLPLTPSNSGLADADEDLLSYYEKMNVIDASAGANYSGGSSWPGDLPLTPSNAGLAGRDGMYDGHRIEDIDRHYGSTIGSLEGENSRNIPGYYNRGQVIDASAGANYSGGSSWPGDLPLTPSNAGLAALSFVEPLDGVSDKLFLSKMFANQRPVFKRLASRSALQNLKSMAMKARTSRNSAKLEAIGRAIARLRAMRRNILFPNQGAPKFGMPTTMSITRVA